MPMDRKTGERIDVTTHIDQCVQNVLQTPTNTRPMDLAYGTDLIELVDLPVNPEGRALIVAKTAGAVTTYETRPTVNRIVVGLDESNPGKTLVDLDWSYEGADATTTTEI